MPPPSPSDRIASALDDMMPAQAVLSVARQLRDQGVPQAELLAYFDSFRARHALDVDETRYNAILDTTDFIVGWCSPSRRLYQE